MSYSFDDTLEREASKYGGSSRFFRINEGNNNVIRILTKGEAFAVQYVNGEYRTLYGRENGDPLRQPDDADANRTGRIVVPLKDGKEDRPSIRTLVYIIDRVDNRVKVAELPYLVVKQVAELQKNPDYGFQDMPMPYDIRITFKKVDDKGKKVPPMQMYRVEVKPTSAEITPEQLAHLSKLMTDKSPEAEVQAKKNRQMEEDMKRGLRISPEELQEAADDFNATMAQKAAEQQQESPKPVMKYPTDEINPEDIPF